MSEANLGTETQTHGANYSHESLDTSSDDQFQSPNLAKQDDDESIDSKPLDKPDHPGLGLSGDGDDDVDQATALDDHILDDHADSDSIIAEAQIVDLSKVSTATDVHSDTGSVLQASPGKLPYSAVDLSSETVRSDEHHIDHTTNDDELSSGERMDTSSTNPSDPLAHASDPELRHTSSTSSFTGVHAPPPLPEREAPPLPPRRRVPFFWLKGKQNSITSITSLTSDDSFGATSSQHHNRSRSLASPEYDLILQRIEANNEGLEAQDSVQRNASLSGIKQLQQSFMQFRQGFSRDSLSGGVGGVGGGTTSATTSTTSSDEDQLLTQSSTGPSDINWEFWSLVVSDYAHVARTRPAELSAAIATGFPSELRGLIWQLITSSKSAALEDIFYSIQSESSPHEKAIKRDLARTSFIRNSNADSLFRIIKGYSLFDPDVGYTQGMAFIAVPLLINMSEPEAFCLLVHLMKDYRFRDMFLPEMPGLHLLLYQYDRLLEDLLPSVHTHLSRQGVRSSMYASQWFLTLFAYKFPLTIVMRIFDIVIAEGLETILKFGVSLMLRNEQKILDLDFDNLLSFLKDHLFDYYLEGGVTTAGEQQQPPQYRVNELVQDACKVKLLPITLRKYKNEYNEIHRLEQDRVQEVESLRSQNGQLILRLRRAEEELTAVNREHIEVTNTLVEYRLENAQLKDDNEQLTAEVEALRQQHKEQGDASLAQEQAGTDLEAQNKELLETKARLEAQLTNLEKELVSTRTELDNLTDQHTSLKGKWDGLLKHIQGDV